MISQLSQRQNGKHSLGARVLWPIALILLYALPIHAQRTTGGVRPSGVNRGVGGAGGGFGGNFGGGAGQRQQYYGPGQVGEAIVTSDPETRRLIVITDEETSQYVSQVITNLDRPKPQVLIKVVFLEVTYGKALDIGVEGGMAKNPGNKLLTASNIFSVTRAPVGPVLGGNQLPGAGLYELSGANFDVLFRAIAQADKTEVLSRPSVLARNNQQAVIVVGQEIPFVTNTRFDAVGGQINTIQYQDVGIILRVTPFITSDGMVEMIVSPEISKLNAQQQTVSSGVSAPIIDKRSADTVVVTQNGQPVVIGGLMQNDRKQIDSKIPLLGDLPLLGGLFRRRATSNNKTELIIFLTPHIVMQPDQLVSLSEHERRNTELLPKSFSEQELNRFIDGLPSKGTPPQGAPPQGNGHSPN